MMFMMGPRVECALATVALAGALVAARPATADDLAPAVEGLLRLWDDADLVCLGEHHGDLDDHALRTALVRHPSFPGTVRVVIVEFVNPLHQELLDRWVVRGEDLPAHRLRPLWRDAGASELWDLPIYEELLRAVRDVNRHLAVGERVRVVGGAAPIPWDQVEAPQDLVPWLDRERLILETVRREVLRPARKGLAIFGAGHCERSGMGFPSRLGIEEAARTRSVFGFFGAEGRQAAREALGVGPGPEWIPVRGTDLAGVAAGRMLFEGHAVARTTLGELADALVFFPPEVTAPRQEPSASVGPGFENELQRRWELLRQAHALPLAHRER